MKKIYSLLLLAGLSIVGCQSSRSIPPLAPRYNYLILHGGKVIGYSNHIPTEDEIHLNVNDMVGAWCLKPGAWSDQVRYIFELETAVGECN